MRPTRQTTFSVQMSREAIVLVLALSACAPHPAAVAPPPLAHQQVIRRTLANGLQVTVVPSTLAPV